MNNPLFILENGLVLKPNDFDPVVFEKPGPFLIINCRKVVKVWLAVQFDAKPFRRTVEIKDVPANAVLASELFAIQLRIFDDRPKSRFRWGHSAAKLGAERFQFRQIMGIGRTSFVFHRENISHTENHPVSLAKNASLPPLLCKEGSFC